MANGEWLTETGKAAVDTLIREHKSILEYAPIGSEAVAFYKARLEVYLFIREAVPRCREPPTDNATLEEFTDKEIEGGK